MGRMARITCWGEKEPLKGEGVRIFEGNMRAHSAKAWGDGISGRVSSRGCTIQESGKTVGTLGCHKRHKSHWAPQSWSSMASSFPD